MTDLFAKLSGWVGFAGLAAAVVLCIGLVLLPPHAGPGWGDGPEFSLAARTLSLVHPPGSPVHALFGRLGAIVASGRGVNAISSLSLVLSAALVAGWIAGLNLAGARSVSWACGIAGGVGVLAGPATPLFGRTAEVYGLATFFSVLAVWFVLSAKTRRHSARSGLLGPFLLGIGSGCHPLPVVLLPWFLRSGRRLGGVLWWCLGVSVFLYLPLRSVHDPVLDWGDPERWTNLLDVLLVREFSGGLTSLHHSDHTPWATVIRSLGSGLGPWAASGLAVALSLWIVSLLRHSPRRVSSQVIGWTALAWVALHLGGGIDVEGYLLLPRTLFLAAAWCGLGWCWRLGGAARWGPVLQGLILCVVVLGVWNGLSELVRIRWVEAPAVEVYEAALLDPIPEGSIIFCDGTVDAFCGLDGADRYRRNVTVVYTPLLGHAWYRRQLSERRPDLGIEIAHSGNAGVVLRSIVAASPATQPLFYSPAGAFLIPPDSLVPWGVVFRIGPHRALPADVHSLAERRDPHLVQRCGVVQAHRSLWSTAQGDLAGALSESADAARWWPENGAVARNHATLLRHSARMEAAVSEARRAVRLARGRVETSHARLELGKCLVGAEQWSEARVVLDRLKVEQFRPAVVEALLMEVRKQQGDRAVAESDAVTSSMK